MLDQPGGPTPADAGLSLPFLRAAAPWVPVDTLAPATYLYGALPPSRERSRPLGVVAPGRRHRPVARAAQRVVAVALVGGLSLLASSVPVGTVVQHVDTALRPPSALVLAAQGVRPVEGGLVLASHEGPLPTTAPNTASRPRAAAGSGGQLVTAVGGAGLAAVPAPVLAAYRAGATAANSARPGCGLSWSVLAGVGELESRHAAAGGSRAAGWDGTASPPILGPVLDGSLSGTAVVRDTDGGSWDGDPGHDRALGPMQMLPATWAAFASDGNGDGRSDPQHVADAAVAAGLYLCASGEDLGDARHLVAALRRYNRSDRYVRAVLAAGAGHLAASLGPSPSGVAQAALAFAWKSLGDPYLWGGNGPLYDCSGLTTAAYRSAGVLLPRTAGEQWQQVPPVPLGQLVVGDLVFFAMGQFRPGVPGHVGVYLGHGLMLNAPRTGAFVRIDSIDRPGIVGAARPSLLATYTGAPVPGSGLVLPAVEAPAVPTPVQRPSATPQAGSPGGTAGPTTAPSSTPAGSTSPSGATPTGATSDRPDPSSTPVTPEPTGAVPEPTPTPTPLDPTPSGEAAAVPVPDGTAPESPQEGGAVPETEAPSSGSSTQGP